MSRLAVSTFSGLGGGALAARRAGYEVKCFDFDSDAHASLIANGLSACFIDIKDVNWAPYSGADIVVGGPPCQSFSAAGLQTGESDPRNAIPAFVDVVRAVRPRVFVMENVRGLTFKKHRDFLNAVIDQFRELGYTVDWRVLNAADFGVPQTRQRVFVVGRLDGPVVWPLATHAKDAAGGDLKPWVTMAEALGYGMTERPSYTVTGGGTETGGAEVFGPGARKGMSEAAWAWDRPATTVVGSFGADVIAGPGYRTTGGPSGQNAQGSVKVSHADRLILQGFPTNWKLKGSKTSVDRQLGNACPPALLQAVIAAQVEIVEVPADTFKLAVDVAAVNDRVRDMLTPHTLDELKEDYTCFLSPDYLTGYLVSHEGDLSNVFNIGPAGRGVAAVAHAVRHGAKTLDCFEPFLPAWYARQGWQATHSEDNWTPGGPAVTYMEYAP